MKNVLKHIPVASLTETVMLPFMMFQLDITRDFCKKAALFADGDSGLMTVFAENPSSGSESPAKRIFDTGVLVKIKTAVTAESKKVLIEGICRCCKTDIYEENGTFFADIAEYNDAPVQPPEATPLVEQARRLFVKYITEADNADAEGILGIMHTSNVSQMLDLMTANVKMPVPIKQSILECLDFMQRLELFANAVADALKFLEIDRAIERKVRKNLDKRQREYYLQEQIRTIQAELGDDLDSEINEYKEKAENLQCSDEIKTKLKKEISKLEKMPSSSAESNVSRTYLDFALSLPWGKKSDENLNIKSASDILNRDHYGLEDVKTRILEHLAVMKLSKNPQGSVLCLVGPPGVGKTSIAKSVASALGREYMRISLGGTRDEADIRGHRKTYIGSMPGRIMTAVHDAKTDNPLILLDEIDKMGADLKGDPTAALLEVLDTAQNNAFRDHYLELPYDLSNVMFIMTANTLDTVPRPLFDRMEIIELSGYTSEEKINIAQKYLVPKQVKKAGLSKGQIKIGKSAVSAIIDGYTRESGVRSLERKIAELCRKTAKKIVEEDVSGVSITAKNLAEFLDKPVFDTEIISDTDEIGVVTGLAWTAAGGDTLKVEVNVMDGTGKIELTGQLGDVMKESAMAAVSYIRSKTNELEIQPDFYKTKDIHVHVPEGATPKDGPSAGITMATAMVSALTNKPVKRSVAMTGEITIRGRVLPIGGLKEKSMAAFRYGVDTIIIPSKNEKDLNKLPEVVREKITFVPADSMDTVLNTALSY